MTGKNPSSIKDITANWLTSALHDSGNLGSQIEITKINTSDIEGHISGTVHRLEVSYSSDTNCPNTFILKFITAQKGDSSPEKELYLYQNIDKFGFPPTFRPPKPYLALKFENNYIFLLEDLACMTQIPQKQEGVDYETAQRIVMSLACFHAKFWDNSDNGLEKLREAYCPLAEQDSYWENLQDNLEKSLEDFSTLVRDKEVQKTSQFCASHLAELVKTSRKPPVTVLQGDASAANYFLEGARGVIAVDWQGLDVGSGPGELAYFLSMSVQEDVRKKHETEFLHLYHDMLAKRGVDTSETGFTFDQCYKKYLIGVATSSLVPIKKARAYLEGRRAREALLDKEKELSQRDKAIHDNVKPMIDLWCITANNHPITSLNLDQ